MSQLRVCHLVHHLALGGLEHQLLRQIREAGEDISSVVVYFGEDESLREEYEAAGAAVARLADGPAGPARQFNPHRLWRVTRFLREQDIDVLHCHTSLYLHVVGRLCGRAAGVPVVGTYHNTRENFHPAIQFAERATRPLSETNVAVSKGVERTFATDASEFQPGDAVERATYTVYNGIDVASFREQVEAADAAGVRSTYGVSEDTLVLLCIGRYSPEKNQELLIRALADAVDDLPPVHLFLVGWGDLADQFRELAGDLGVADRVTVTGRVPSVHEYYGAADAFVLPSSTEGLSVTLLEAMSAGLPVVATDVSGTAEAVVNGETGFVVPSDSRSALADAIRRLGETDQAKLGELGRNRARDRFDIDTTVAAYRALYESVTQDGLSTRGPTDERSSSRSI